MSVQRKPINLVKDDPYQTIRTQEPKYDEKHPNIFEPDDGVIDIDESIPQNNFYKYSTKENQPLNNSDFKFNSPYPEDSEKREMMIERSEELLTFLLLFILQGILTTFLTGPKIIDLYWLISSIVMICLYVRASGREKAAADKMLNTEAARDLIYYYRFLYKKITKAYTINTIASVIIKVLFFIL